MCLLNECLVFMAVNDKKHRFGLTLSNMILALALISALILRIRTAMSILDFVHPNRCFLLYHPLHLAEMKTNQANNTLVLDVQSTRSHAGEISCL